VKSDRKTAADQRHRTLALWRNLWTTLIFALGLAATLFFIGAICLFVRESWIAGAISTVASIFSGGTVPWLVARRQEAVKEEERAFQEAVKAAAKQDQTDAAQQAREGVFGRLNSPRK
jgi:hypothetical protein